MSARRPAGAGVGEGQGSLDLDPADTHSAPSREVVRVYSDGGARGNPGPAAIGAVVLDPSTDPPEVLAEVSEQIGVATNNVAEYKALLAGLEAAKQFGARRVEVRADSMLVLRQVEGRWRVKEPTLRPYCEQARALLRSWREVDLEHVRRDENAHADALVNRALDAPRD